jgi:regulatory protein
MLRRITKIEVQKRRPRRRSLFLDGDFFCGVEEEVVVKLRLKEGKEIDDEEIARIAETEEETKARRYGISLLSYRMRSRKELSRRLQRKGYSQETVDRVTSDLEEAGLIDDLEFARLWMRSRMESSPRSFYAIRRELFQKGVDREKIENAQCELEREFDEKEIALSLAKKRLSRLKGLEKRDRERRLLGFLKRRGFDYETVRSVLAELKDGQNDIQ